MNELYKENLQLIKQVLHNGGTTREEELDYLARELFGDKYKGLYSSSEKHPEIESHGDFAIINKPLNTHWICIFNYRGTKYEFDSFGNDMMGDGYIDFNTSNDEIEEQYDNESNCGQRVLAMMVSLFSST